MKLEPLSALRSLVASTQARNLGQGKDHRSSCYQRGRETDEGSTRRRDQPNNSWSETLANGSGTPTECESTQSVRVVQLPAGRFFCRTTNEFSHRPGS